MSRLRPFGFRDHVDDVEDEDAALSGEVFAATGDGGTDTNEGLAFMSVFGDFQGKRFDAHDYFGGGEWKSGWCVR